MGRGGGASKGVSSGGGWTDMRGGLRGGLEEGGDGLLSGITEGWVWPTSRWLSWKRKAMYPAKFGPVNTYLNVRVALGVQVM